MAVGLLLLAGGAIWALRTAFIEQALREGDTARLIARVDCETCPLRDRNRAVWALGQSSYARDNTVVLPVLRKHLAAIPECDHARLLCRYELRKAILKIEDNWDLRASLSAGH